MWHHLEMRTHAKPKKIYKCRTIKMEQLLCKWSELLGMVIRHTFKTHIYVGEQIGSLHLQYIISWYLWPYNILQPTNETFQNHNILNYTPNIWNIDTDTDTKQWWSRTFQDLSWSTNWETYLSKEFVKQSSWQCFVTFLGWLSDPLKWLSDLHFRDRPVDHKPGDRTGPSPDRPENAEDFQCPLGLKKTFYLLNQFLFSIFQLLCAFGVGSGEHIFLIMHNKSCIVPTPKTNIFQALFIFGGWIRGTHLSNYAQQKLHCPNPKT